MESECAARGAAEGSLREVCDAAEVVRGRLEDRRDQLRLLALIARGNGFDNQDLQDYVPASEKLAAGLAELTLSSSDVKRSRELEVAQFLAQAGGD